MCVQLCATVQGVSITLQSRRPRKPSRPWQKHLAVCWPPISLHSSLLFAFFLLSLPAIRMHHFRGAFFVQLLLGFHIGLPEGSYTQLMYLCDSSTTPL